MRILRVESGRALRAIVLGALAILAALELAFLGSDPRWGNVTLLFLGVLFLCTVLFAIWGWWRARQRTFEMANAWHQWMRFSVNATSIAEIERKAQNRGPPPSWVPGAIVAAFILANGVVFALLWYDAPPEGPAAYAMASLNAIGLGWLLGTRALQFWWARSAAQAANELVGNGTLSVWGER